MKRFIALLLALIMTFSLAACAADEPENNGGETVSDNAADNAPANNTANDVPADDTANVPADEPADEPEPVSPFADKAWYADGELTILGIGNSFTDDTLANMYYAAKCAGIENVKVCYAIVGGCTLQRHMTYALQNSPLYGFYESNDGVNYSYTEGHALLDIIGKYKWDFVSFQQQSIDACNPATYGVLNMFVDKVREVIGEEPVLVWNMTWAYQADCTQERFKEVNNDQMAMYNAIVATTGQVIVPNTKFSYIAPIGTAIQNGRTSSLGDTFTRDGYHLSYEEGRYIATLTFLCTVLELDPDSVDFNLTGVDPTEVAICKEAVKNALANPFEVTPSSYT